MPLEFVASLTANASDIRRIIRMWDKSGDQRNPFASVLVTPLFATQATLEVVKQLKEERASKVYFDSGGFWVRYFGHSWAIFPLKLLIAEYQGIKRVSIFVGQPR